MTAALTGPRESGRQGAKDRGAAWDPLGRVPDHAMVQRRGVEPRDAALRELGPATARAVRFRSPRDRMGATRAVRRLCR